MVEIRLVSKPLHLPLIEVEAMTRLGWEETIFKFVQLVAYVHACK